MVREVSAVTDSTAVNNKQTLVSLGGNREWGQIQYDGKISVGLDLSQVYNHHLHDESKTNQNWALYESSSHPFTTP